MLLFAKICHLSRIYVFTKLLPVEFKNMNKLKNKESASKAEKNLPAIAGKMRSGINANAVRIITTLFVAALTLVPLTRVYAANDELFPRPAEIEPDVKFWTRVFTEITTKQGFIHDDRYLGVVYEKIDLPEDVSRREQQKYIEHRKEHYEHILRRLSSNRTGLSVEEQRVLNLWPDDVSDETLRSATNRLRFQLGQADKYLAGLQRSGAWKAYIVKTLEEMGLPKEISSLPHVESSFNPYAYSKVGAAGLWQFTRSTGLRFMRIDHIVDERMDPFKATIAAAQLLENNYAVTGTWPLALTAYNHGAAGMRNAARVMGTTDIVTILRKYRSRSFQFASRNFYVAFLAAVDVEKNAEKYFGTVKLDPPIEDEIINTPAYVSINDIQKALGVSMYELKEKNPALRPSVWSGQKLVPRGYELRISKGKAPENAEQLIAQIPATKLYAKQRPDLYHRVSRGQTLSSIARHYHVSVRQLMAVNSLHSKHRIYVGQRLRLPQHGGSTMVATASLDSTKKKKVSVDSLEDGLYTVRKGDSIHKISKRFGISQGQILALNDLNRVNRIYPGQVLRLTASEDTSVENSDADTTEVDTAEADTANETAVENPTLQGASTEEEQVSADSQDDASQDASTVVDSPIDESTTTADNQDESPQDASTVNESQIADSGETAGTSPEDSTATVLPNLPPITETLQLPANTSVAKIEDSNAATVTADKAAPAAEGNADTQTVNVDSGAISEEVDQDLKDDLDLAADPSDYSVASNHTIEVQAAETLGHYAEWLKLRASQLRHINRMRYGKPVVIGKRIKLDFSRVTPEEFELQRKEYHRILQEEFFNQFEIAGSEKHVIRRGESIWRLAKGKYNIPIWLLRQYNPDLSISNIKPGTEVTFPQIEERTDNSDGNNGASKDSSDLVANKE